MSHRSFAHLHCHSHYSLLDGAAKIEDLVLQAKSLGMSALALTDHGNLYGAIEFYQSCKKHGINPVLGYEAYVAPARRDDRQTRGGIGGEASFHLTLLAQNRTGFQNLIKLASHAFLEGFYYKPRIDKELLEAHREGLVILSGCAASEFSTLLLAQRLDEAAELAAWFSQLLGDRFYIEIQDNGLDIQKECAAGAIEVANRLGLPLVATCDSHYLCVADAAAHEVLLCINTGKTMSDPKRLQYGSDQFYLKSPEEMYASFPAHPDAVARAQAIADSCAIDLDFTKRHFPVFHPPEGFDDRAYLRQLCEAGLERRYGHLAAERREQARARLEHELGIIERLGFASYFLIVWDFVNFAEQRGIPCGARGSACGAVVSYLLGFSNVDPIEYDLLFERFLDPSRVEAPDIDIDFCQERRDEVIAYVREKYGERNVAQIITFGTMAARAVIRDVGRALEVSLPRVDQIAKLVPKTLNITLQAALVESPELKREYDADPEVRRLIDIGMRLEGLARNPGTHAAGVVVADSDLTQYVPLQKNGDVLTTQWEMSILEKVGMLKFDFLGLRNLTILTDAIEVIRQVTGQTIRLAEIPLDDEATFGLLQRGETKGVFQLESEGIRGLLVRLRPDRFQDIIAVNALYRPGPLGGGMVDKYINVKHGREAAEYAHPVMKAVLEETYGVMVYQEQVMRILNRLGGIELADAYKCIKAISKKNKEVMDSYQSRFIAGAGKQGLSADKANEIFELIKYFAGYGFNKSHSTAYALVAYQTAYLKAHFPAEFMAALMSSELGDTDKLAEHIEDCRRMKLAVKPPDVNLGAAKFTVAAGALRFGLVAIKGVGEKAIAAIVSEREQKGAFRDLYDFCERVDTKLVTKACIESLIKAGAMDCFGAFRAQLVDVLPTAFGAGGRARADRDSGQGFLFGEEKQDAVGTLSLPSVPEWPDREKLEFEKELLGIYLSSHPLAHDEPKLRLYRTHRVAELAELPDRKPVVVGGMIEGVRVLVQQRGRNANQKYARFTITDLSASIPCVMFADAYADHASILKDGSIWFIEADVDRSRETPGLIAQRLVGLDHAGRELGGTLLVRLREDRHDEATVDQLAGVLETRPGKSPVYLEVAATDGIRARLKLGDRFNVTCDQELATLVEDIVGAGQVTIKPARPAIGSRPTNGNRYARTSSG